MFTTFYVITLTILLTVKTIETRKITVQFFKKETQSDIKAIIILTHIFRIAFYLPLIIYLLNK